MSSAVLILPEVHQQEGKVYHCNVYNSNSRLSLTLLSFQPHTVIYVKKTVLISDHGLGIDYQFADDHNLNMGSLIPGRLELAVLGQCHEECTVCDGSLALRPDRGKERGIDLLASPQASHLGKCSIIQRERDKCTPLTSGED